MQVQSPIRAVAAALLFAASLAALAAPDATPADPVMRLLNERGLIDAAQQASNAPLVQRVRDRASDLVLSAMNFLGVPYRRGGTTEAGFDCSGFTRHIFELSVGLVLPRRAAEQAKAPGLLPVRKDELKPGDLVFFNTLRHAFSHVGIYVGEGKFIHAPRSGSEVRVEDMREAYWARRFNGGRRADLASAPAPAPEASVETAPTVDPVTR